LISSPRRYARRCLPFSRTTKIAPFCDFSSRQPKIPNLVIAGENSRLAAGAFAAPAGPKGADEQRLIRSGQTRNAPHLIREPARLPQKPQPLILGLLVWDRLASHEFAQWDRSSVNKGPHALH
jgi:hypothetical protein